MSFEGRAIAHVLVEDAAAARTALEGAGIKVEGEAEPLVSEFPSPTRSTGPARWARWPAPWPTPG